MFQRTYKNKEINTTSSDNWRTPKPFFDLVNAEFHFEVDRAADKDNHLLPDYDSLDGLGGIDNNAFSKNWCWTGWANIPYSRPAQWFQKARESAINLDTTTVLLVKAATSENYWVENVKDAHVRFIHSRMKFWDENNKPHYTAKFANALVIFAPYTIGNPKTEYWDYKEKAVKLF